MHILLGQLTPASSGTYITIIISKISPSTISASFPLQKSKLRCAGCGWAWQRIPSITSFKHFCHQWFIRALSYYCWGKGLGMGMVGKECEATRIKMPKECCRSSSFVLSYCKQPCIADYFQSILSAFEYLDFCFQEREGSHLRCAADCLTLCQRPLVLTDTTTECFIWAYKGLGMKQLHNLGSFMLLIHKSVHTCNMKFPLWYVTLLPKANMYLMLLSI